MVFLRHPFFFLLICGYLLKNCCSENEIQSDIFPLDIAMPNIVPNKPDTYLCVSRKIEDSGYIVNFEPHAHMDTVHHMLLYGCEIPASNDAHWECINMGTCRSNSKILFAWARDAPPLNLPNDVGFHIGGDSGINYVVAQIHYGNINDKFLNGETDSSGIELMIAKQKQKFLAGIYLMATSKINIPAHSKDVHIKMHCVYKEETRMYAFAYRTHTHELGQVVSGYRIRNHKWTLLGKMDPKLPEAFYPINQTYTIEKNDEVAAECIYNGRDEFTHVGPTGHDEMCNFYLMYYHESNNKGISFGCFENDDTIVFPPGSDVFNDTPNEVPIQSKLKVVEDWSLGSNTDFGQVSGISLDKNGNVVIFHRGKHVWGKDDFSNDNIYLKDRNDPINEATVVTLDKDTGHIIHKWGENKFYLPHGLTIDDEGNVWLTDVAMHQVFKFPSKGGNGEPLFTLGIKFEPGSDTDHFCKPTDVAVDSRNGNFYVSDGYCNSRIMMFDPNGKLVFHWGKKNTLSGSSFPGPEFLNLPHSLTLAEDKNQLCVADRENSRVQCFLADTGKFKKQFYFSEFGERVMAIVYNPKDGGTLYAINGINSAEVPVQGLTIDFESSLLKEKWTPTPIGNFNQPHDITVSDDNVAVYVSEIGPNNIWKFMSKGLSPCQKDIFEMAKSNLVGSYVPQCTPDGDYSPTQCHGSIGYCWCVNQKGQPIKNTRVHGYPLCNGNWTATIAQSGFIHTSTHVNDTLTMNEKTNEQDTSPNILPTVLIVTLLTVPVVLLIISAVIGQLYNKWKHGNISKSWLHISSEPKGFNAGNFFDGSHKGFNKLNSEEFDIDPADLSEESEA